MRTKVKYSLLISFILISISRSIYGQNDPNLNVTHGPWIQNLTNNSVTIIWITNEPAVPGILIGTDTGNLNLLYNSEDGMINAGDTLHKVKISGLQPGTEYLYRLYSRQIDIFEPYKITYSDTIVSSTYKFKTLTPQREIVNFIVFNDVHNNSSKMASYLKHINLESQDIWFFNGDMIDYVQDLNQITTGFLDTAVHWFAKNKPFVYVRGNHEARGKYARKFKDYFDFNGDSFYGSFDIGPVHFIVLDTGEDKPDSSKYYYQLADFDNYRRRQMHWLKNEINTERFRNAKFRIVLCHMPIYKQERMGYGMQFLSDNYGPILEKAGIDLMLSGHTHSYAYLDSKNTGFGYPVLVNSSSTFLEVSVDNNGIKLSIRSTNGNIINEINLKKNKN